MKKIVLAATALFFAGSAMIAQVSMGGRPYSYTNNIGLELQETETLPALDMVAVHALDAKRETDGLLRLHSRLIDVSYTLDNSGTWQSLPNGDRLWTLKIKSTGAIGLSVGYTRFKLPKGSRMFVYNEDQTEFLGAFSDHNNVQDVEYATSYTRGDVTVLEYYEPANVAGEGIINLDWVSHIYRDLKTLAEEEAEAAALRADPCQVNIRCDEGAPYWDEKKGVVRISVISGQGAGWCTGSLVNNTNEDCKGYILTALHCTDGSSSSHFNQYTFTFNYERVQCNGGPSPNNNLVTGCVRRADSNDGGGNSGSDFALVELNEAIPEAYDPYWIGWNASTTAPPNGVGIHHPSGDNKKISTFNSQPISSSWGASGTHWRVNWNATTNGHGVTEGGSSGSPIFNERGKAQIVGTLTGGASYCNEVQPGGQNQPDYYGKMSHHWNSNPNSAAEKLKVWLDPVGNGTTTEMEGSFKPCGAFTGMEETDLESQLEVMPNPNNGSFDLVLNLTDLSDLRIEVYSAMGQLIESHTQLNNGRLHIDLTDHATGLYYVNVNVAGAKVTRKVIVE